jgi:formate hydrogenlyase subunit 4
MKAGTPYHIRCQRCRNKIRIVDQKKYLIPYLVINVVLGVFFVTAHYAIISNLLITLVLWIVAFLVVEFIVSYRISKTAEYKLPEH